MTPPFTTAFYAALCALLLVALAINVIRHRGKLRVSLGHADNPSMEQAVRMHGNAVEYIPITLLLMAFYEMEHGSIYLVHAAGILLIIGRLLHVTGIAAPHSIGRGRSLGMGITFIVMLVLIAALLIKSVMIFTMQ